MKKQYNVLEIFTNPLYRHIIFYNMNKTTHRNEVFTKVYGYTHYRKNIYQNTVVSDIMQLTQVSGTNPSSELL